MAQSNFSAAIVVLTSLALAGGGYAHAADAVGETVSAGAAATKIEAAPPPAAAGDERLSVTRNEEALALPAASIALAADGKSVERELMGVRMRVSLAECPGFANLLPALADVPARPVDLGAVAPNFPNDLGANRYDLSYLATIAGRPVRVSQDGRWRTTAWNWSERAFAAVALCLDGRPEPVPTAFGNGERYTFSLQPIGVTLDPGDGGRVISITQSGPGPYPVGGVANVALDLCPAPREELAKLATFTIVPAVEGASVLTRSPSSPKAKVSYTTSSNGLRGGMSLESLTAKAHWATG